MPLLKLLSVTALLFIIIFISICCGVILWTTYEYVHSENSLCSFPDEEVKNNENVKINPNLELLSKREWGGMCSRHGLIRTNVPASLVVICHTATKKCGTRTQCSNAIKGFQNNHILDRQLPDIDYNFIVGGDGNVYIGTGWNLRRTLDRIKISFIGSYNYDKFEKSMMLILLDILDYGLQKEYLDPEYKITAHNLTTRTISPGENIYKVIQRFPRFSNRILYT